MIVCPPPSMPAAHAFEIFRGDRVSARVAKRAESCSPRVARATRSGSDRGQPRTLDEGPHAALPRLPASRGPMAARTANATVQRFIGVAGAHAAQRREPRNSRPGSVCTRWETAAARRRHLGRAKAGADAAASASAPSRRARGRFCATRPPGHHAARLHAATVSSTTRPSRSRAACCRQRRVAVSTSTTPRNGTQSIFDDRAESSSSASTAIRSPSTVLSRPSDETPRRG